MKFSKHKHKAFHAVSGNEEQGTAEEEEESDIELKHKEDADEEQEEQALFTNFKVFQNKSDLKYSDLSFNEQVWATAPG